MMQATDTDKWNILVVDDDELIHDMTKINLSELNHDGKGLSLLHAYSAAEAQRILKDHTDISIIILDVMMENDDAGLGFVKFVRDEIKNDDVGILLHTGQPGIAPKKAVSDQYDIDGYLDKNVADNDDCYVAVRLALRSYQERIRLKKEAENDDVLLLEKIAEAYVALLSTSFVALSDYEVTMQHVNTMVHLSQKILAGYALSDMKKGVAQGTTKAARLAYRDYSALIQIHDIKVILTHTTQHEYQDEYMAIAQSLLQAARNFSEIAILSKAAREKLMNSVAQHAMIDA